VRSSSSSAPDATFASFLAGSLDLLERELPWAYGAMCRVLAPREVLLSVDGEDVSVRCTERTAIVGARAAAPDVECRTTRAAILDLADASTSLVDAVMSDRVHLRGAVGDLLAFHDGLMAYLGGAVRSPSFPALLERFRRTP
jgi:hypothetical protein